VATRADACVEDAGGEVWPLDAGRITNGNAGSRMTANFLGAVAQYHRDITREKAGEAQERAVSRESCPTRTRPLVT
jgi:DNA invertase Pin-like site-specific DNA recombinase